MSLGPETIKCCCTFRLHFPHCQTIFHPRKLFEIHFDLLNMPKTDGQEDDPDYPTSGPKFTVQTGMGVKIPRLPVEHVQTIKASLSDPAARFTAYHNMIQQFFDDCWDRWTCSNCNDIHGFKNDWSAKRTIPPRPPLFLAKQLIVVEYGSRSIKRHAPRTRTAMRKAWFDGS